MAGKTLRGARVGDGRAVHLPAAMVAEIRTVIAQRESAPKTGEITTFAPLLDELDLTGTRLVALAHGLFKIDNPDTRGAAAVGRD